MLQVFDLQLKCDEATFQKALELYRKNKVVEYENHGVHASATVLGTNPYYVSINTTRPDHGHCDCYMGQQGYWCKHMVALALHAIKDGRPIEPTDLQNPLVTSLSEDQSISGEREVKKEITRALGQLKGWSGLSRNWFSYQDGLSEGVNRLESILAILPWSDAKVKNVLEILIRIEKKLMNGIDDSDGTVGGCMQALVDDTAAYLKAHPESLKHLNILRRYMKDKDHTSFDWQDALLALDIQ